MTAGLVEFMRQENIVGCSSVITKQANSIYTPKYTQSTSFSWRETKKKKNQEDIQFETNYLKLTVHDNSSGQLNIWAKRQ